jgi:hypothetical protein
MKGKNMDIKKIIGMGILCGLSFSGSATVNSGLGSQYPVARYNPAQGCQGYRNDSPFLDCFSSDDYAVLQGLFQKITNNASDLVDNNPTDGAALGAILLSGAWEIHNLFKMYPEMENIFRKAFNGRLTPAEKRALQNELNQQGTQILDWANCFIANSCLPYDYR